LSQQHNLVKSSGLSQCSQSPYILELGSEVGRLEIAKSMFFFMSRPYVEVKGCEHSDYSKKSRISTSPTLMSLVEIGPLGTGGRNGSGRVEKISVAKLNQLSRMSQHITLFRSITMFYGTDSIPRSIWTECEEYLGIILHMYKEIQDGKYIPS